MRFPLVIHSDTQIVPQLISNDIYIIYKTFTEK